MRTTAALYTSTRFDLSAAFLSTEGSIYWSMPDVGTKSLLDEFKLWETPAMKTEDATPSFMEHLLVSQTINKTTEYMTGTIVERDSNTTFHSLQLQ